MRYHQGQGARSRVCCWRSALAACGERRRRRRRRSRSSGTARVRGGHDDGQAQRGGQDRRSASSTTSPASASMSPVRTSRGLRHRDRQDHRRRARHRRPATSSGRRRCRTTASRSCRTARSTSSSRPTRSPTSGARSSVRPGPYYVTGQQLLVAARTTEHDHRPDDLEGKKVCSVTGSTSIETVTKEYGAKPVAVRHLLRVRDPAPERLGRRGDDRRRDPARLRRPGPGRAQGRRRGVQRGALRRGLQARTTPRCASSSPRRLQTAWTTARGPRRSKPRWASPASRRPSRRSSTPASKRASGTPAASTMGSPACRLRDPWEDPAPWTILSEQPRPSSCTAFRSRSACLPGRGCVAAVARHRCSPAMRVSPIAPLRRVRDVVRQRVPQHAARSCSSSSPWSGCPQLGILQGSFFSRAVAIALRLYTAAFVVRGAPLRHQHRRSGPGRGGAVDRHDVRPVASHRRPPAGLPGRDPAAGQRLIALAKNTSRRRRLRGHRGDLPADNLNRDFPTRCISASSGSRSATS